MVFCKVVDIISAAAKAKSLRISSSLQELSTYSRIEAEDGEISGGSDPAGVKFTHTLSFSKEKGAAIGNPFPRKRWIWLLVLVLWLLFFGFLLFLAVQCSYRDWYGGASSKFYVVVDCGSTGNRVYIYEASVNHNRNGNLPIVLRSYSEFCKKAKGQIGRAYDRMETEPGLDKLVGNGSGLKAAVKPLVRWAEKKIPQKSHKSTSLFLYATAGVRRLPGSDSAWLLKNVWPILKSSRFTCEKEWVKTITGMEEAYYGWISLNYQAGILGSMPKTATFGALDLGGSSLQVTFETKVPAQKETNLNLSIGSVNHHLSAYSLSGYGLNDAFDKSVVQLLKRLPNVDAVDLLNGKLEIKHPCLQTGFKKQYRCSRCASMTHASGSPHNGGKGFGKGGKAGVSVWLTGAPKWDECRALAKSAVNFSEWSSLSRGVDCGVHPCALSESLPRPFGQFYAISGFFVVYRFFNLTSEATLDHVLQKGHEFCDKTWKVAHKSVPPQPFIEQYCFRAPYIVSLLREGLHITDEQITIGSGSISWTLGVALVEAGKEFSSRTEPQGYQLTKLRIEPIHLFAVLLVSSILLMCSVSCNGKCIPNFFRWPHIPPFSHKNGSATSALSIPSLFKFQRRSPISSGDGRVKMPLSPTAGEQVRSFTAVNRVSGSSTHNSATSLYSGTGCALASVSPGFIGHMQFENNGQGSTWFPRRSQMRLQS